MRYNILLSGLSTDFLIQTEFTGSHIKHQPFLEDSLCGVIFIHTKDGFYQTLLLLQIFIWLLCKGNSKSDLRESN